MQIVGKTFKFPCGSKVARRYKTSAGNISLRKQHLKHFLADKLAHKKFNKDLSQIGT